MEYYRRRLGPEDGYLPASATRRMTDGEEEEDGEGDGRPCSTQSSPGAGGRYLVDYRSPHSTDR